MVVSTQKSEATLSAAGNQPEGRMMGRKREKLSLCHTHLAILPPVLVLEFGSAALELRGSGLQGVGAVVQLRQLLISLQDFVHIHAHDVDHLRDEDTHQHLCR